MAAGRPTKYKPEFCERVIECGKDGMSKAEMAAELDVAYSTFDLWQEVHPEFSEAVKDAVARSQAWWEKLGRTGAMGEDINATVWIFNMKNRFRADWADRSQTELTGKDGGAIKTEETGQGAAKLMNYLDGIAERSRATSDPDPE